MGTFRVVRAVTVAALDRFVNGSVAGWEGGSGAITDADLLANWISGIILCVDNITGSSMGKSLVSTIQYDFDLHTEIVLLDGTTLVSYETLPAGFTLTSVRVTIPGQATNSDLVAGGGTSGALSDLTQSIIIQVESGVFVKAFPFSNAGSGVTSLVGLIGPLEYDWDMTSAPTMLDVLGNTFVISVNMSLASSVSQGITLAFGSGNQPEGILIEGTYEIQQFTWTLETPDDPVSVGDPIDVTSGTLDLSSIDDIIIQYFDNTGVLTSVTATINSQTVNSLNFTLPDFTTGQILHILAVGDGSQFTGSIELGQLLTINFTTGSGIYKLVVGQAYDTLYVNGTPETVDVKIPNPFAKLGFVP